MAKQGATEKISDLVRHQFHSAWLRWKHHKTFGRIGRFCLFIGYPRSGHSVIAAFLNAHKNAVISHELDIPPLVLRGCSRNNLYSQLLARAQWFHEKRKNKGSYDYRIPGQWQGRFESLRTIGDKRGGALSRALLEHPDFLQRVRVLTGVPLRLIHVVRNPYDNIAAISIWHHLPLRESVPFYFQHCRAIRMLDSLAVSEELISIRHEEMILSPEEMLMKLCAHLDLDIYPGYLEDCSRIVFRKPSYTRRKADWTGDLVREVEERMREFPFLSGYGYAIPGDDS